MSLPRTDVLLTATELHDQFHIINDGDPGLKLLHIANAIKYFGVPEMVSNTRIRLCHSPEDGIRTPCFVVGFPRALRIIFLTSYASGEKLWITWNSRNAR